MTTNHANITNIPDRGHKKGFFSGRHSHFAILVQENSPFYGQQAHFSVPVQENSCFHGQKKQPKAVLSRRRELNYVKAVRIPICLCKYTKVSQRKQSIVSHYDTVCS